MSCVEHRDMKTWRHAFRRRPGDPADGAGAAAGAGGAAATGDQRRPLRAALIASLLLFVDRRRDRPHHQGQQCPRSGALPRFHRRRDAGADGAGVHLLPQLGYRAATGRIAVCSPGCTAADSCCTSWAWCGRAATACSARSPVPSRCCAPRGKWPAWA